MMESIVFALLFFFLGRLFYYYVVCMYICIIIHVQPCEMAESHSYIYM